MRCTSIFSSLLVGASVVSGLQYVGADWSSVLLQERAGISYTDTNGQSKPLEQLLKENGVNTVRQRIWVNPSNGDYNLNYNLQLARRAKAAGLNVYLDFHYSDNWADPGKQYAPSGWPTDMPGLSKKLYDYTLEVCNAFQAIGVAPNIISIGNEIRTGLLWPTGRTNNFGNIAQLLKSASTAVKNSSLSPKPKIMLHLDNGWDWGLQQWWYDSLFNAGGFGLGDFDQMGVSYYPFYGSSATLSALRTSLQNMVRKYGKEVVVAETNWPQSCPRPSHEFPADIRNIPFSAEGQADFMRKVASALNDSGRGTGIFYWEPAWMNNAGLGSSCESNTMFSWPGRALSSLSVFRQL